MDELCKLTTQQMTTFGGYQWRSREWREAPGRGPLCASGWIHIYTHPLMATAMNPIHANIDNARLWAVEVGGRTLDDDGLKLGVQKCRLLYERPLPVISTDALVRWAILCARTSPQPLKWLGWSERWLSGEDRSEARAAEWLVAASEAEASWPALAASRAGSAAEAAPRPEEAWWAAEAAAWSVSASWAAARAGSASGRAEWSAAEWSAEAAEWSAAAAFASAPIPLIDLLRQAIVEEG
jgi:hypothetical protein